MNQSTSRKVAVVTGGASGIGLGIVQVFAKEGAHVAILDINIAIGKRIVPKLKSDYAEADFSFHKCDVASWDDQLKAFQEIYSSFGRIDAVAANAGISSEDSLTVMDEDVPSKPSLKAVDVNMIGVIYTTKLGIHYISKNEVDPTSSKGMIVCTASNAGIYAFPVAPIYGMTKAAVINLVRSLARPLKEQNIRINAFAPAVLKTNIAPSEALFDDMILTPMSTLQAALRHFIQDESLSGCVAEVHGDKFTMRDVPSYVDQDTETNLETFWRLGYA